MSIRSIDMMIMYSKSADVEKAQTGEQQQNRVMQQSIAAEEVHDKDIKHSQVQRSEQENESERIREQPERKRGRRLGAHAQGQQGQEQEEASAEEEKQPQEQPKFRLPTQTGKIDIRI